MRCALPASFRVKPLARDSSGVGSGIACSFFRASSTEGRSGLFWPWTEKEWSSLIAPKGSRRRC